MSANIAILGNLGRSPETHTNAQGTLIANFSIVSNSVRKTAQGNVNETNWFRVTAFGKQAETVAVHAKKGAKLLVQGKLTFTPWLDRNGAPRVSADLLLQDFQFVGGMEDGADESAEDVPKHSVETEISGDIQEIFNQKSGF